MFNRTFYRFTLGFIGILLASFAVAVLASYVDSRKEFSASVSESGEGRRD